MIYDSYVIVAAVRELLVIRCRQLLKVLNFGSPNRNKCARLRLREEMKYSILVLGRALRSNGMTLRTMHKYSYSGEFGYSC